MTITTKRLILRPWVKTDAESLYEFAKDPRIGPAAGWPVHTSIQNSRQIIKNVLSAPETYAVCLKTDNRAIGSIGLIKPVRAHTEISSTEMEIGFWIGVPFWGKGLIPEAVEAIMARAFGELGLTALWCGYYDGNEKSRRVQEKCGFKYHHTCPDTKVIMLNETRVEHFSVLTRDEFMAGKIIKNI